MSSLCGQCITPYSKAWCIGEKQGALEQLIDAHKFERAKDAYRVFAELLHDSLPVIPGNIRVVPVPTVPMHVRRRGYDHTALLAKEFAVKRQLTTVTPLSRLTRTTQRGASRSERRNQAERAFTCEPLNGGVYLLLDDVYTTGATVEYAARALRDAGADDVWVAVIARQPLEK
jgi:ComF family protein